MKAKATTTKATTTKATAASKASKRTKPQADDRAACMALHLATAATHGADALDRSLYPFNVPAEKGNFAEWSAMARAAKYDRDRIWRASRDRKGPSYVARQKEIAAAGGSEEYKAALAAAARKAGKKAASKTASKTAAKRKSA